MKYLIILLISLLHLITYGQTDTIIFTGSNGNINPDERKVLKKEIRVRNNKRVKIKTYKLDEDREIWLFTERITIKSLGIHEIRIKGLGFSEQLVRKFSEQSGGVFGFIETLNGLTKRKGTTRSKIPLQLDGEVTEYYSNGNLKSRSIYENNELVSNENWTSSGERYIDNVFYSVDLEPRFILGTAYLHNHVLKTFRESKFDLSQLEGRIVAGFVVMEDGSIEGIRIEEGMGRELNDLAIRSLNTLIEQWQPARLNGENVRFYQLFPINFIYNKVDFDNLELKGSMLYWEMN